MFAFSGGITGMESITEWLGAFVRDWLGGVLAAAIGFIGKGLYDIFQEKIRLRHLQNIFGNVYQRPGSIRVVVPLFEPKTYDNFYPEQATKLFKKKLVNARTNETECRPQALFSDVIVADDYRAFRHIDQLFRRYRYGEIEIIADDAALSDWRTQLILCIGGPVSNLKLHQTLERLEKKVLRLRKENETLANLELLTPEGPFSLQPTAEKSFGYILKVTNPVRNDGKIIAIAGDSALATEMTAEYFSQNIERISHQFGQRDFVILLVLDRKVRDTISVQIEYALDEI
jgi:hypothetical protein